MPSEHRADVDEIDVSDIDLNEELGEQWRIEVEREYERLQQTEFCDEALEDSEASLAAATWKRHGYWVVAGGALLLLLMTPWASRTMGTGRWVRLMFVMVPLLGYAVFAAWGATTVQETLARIKDDVVLCSDESFATAEPNAQGSMIDRLRARIQARHQERQAEIDRLFEDQRTN